MALIKCGECNREISSKAASCPGCGAPITIGGAEIGPGNTNLQTVQETSKKFKGRLVFAWGCGIFGLVAISSNDESFAGFGTALILFGVFLWLYTKVNIWWHHS